MATAREMMAAGTPAGQANSINGAKSDLVGAGTAASDAAPILTSVVVVTGANNSGVRLPSGEGTDTFYIFNNSGNTIKLYAPVGGTLNGGSTDAAESLGSTTCAIAKAISNMAYMVVLGA